MDEFYRTRMGVTFFNHTMPELVAALQTLNKRLAARERDADIDELLLATHGLVDAAREVLDVKIVPGSPKTVAAFDNLRERMATARAAADAHCKRGKGPTDAAS